VSESQLLAFDAETEPEVRAWIDADLVCQGELHDSRLAMTILRAATIVTETGEFLNSPPLGAGDAPLGFDPLLAVVSERDVARALVLALHADRPGIYNIAGREVFPRSQLARAPGTLESARWLVERVLLRRPAPASALHRYGIVPSTRLAHDALGFEPQYRVEVRGSGARRRIDTVRCR
jgi:nucleoside-diphosphate-sugar epimerase